MDLFTASDALISPCGAYRHWLTRRWGDGPTCGWIMLNPSTADADHDDRTIGRCISFAKREGCGGLIVGNLFQLRATDPDELRRHPDPLGPDPDDFLLLVASKSDGPLIAGWGEHPFARGRGEYVAAMLGGSLSCLGRTKDGYPRHPLYRKASTPLEPLVPCPEGRP